MSATVVEGVDCFMHHCCGHMILSLDIVRAEKELAVVLKAAGQLTVAPPTFDLPLCNLAPGAPQMREHESHSRIPAKITHMAMNEVRDNAGEKVSAGRVSIAIFSTSGESARSHGRATSGD
jgi:hypothetical protein